MRSSSAAKTSIEARIERNLACASSGYHDETRAQCRLLRVGRQARSWAEIGRFVGQRKLSVTADVYTHVLTDGREVKYEELLASR
jgi:hypothetical protein